MTAHIASSTSEHPAGGSTQLVRPPKARARARATSTLALPESHT